MRIRRQTARRRHQARGTPGRPRDPAARACRRPGRRFQDRSRVVRHPDPGPVVGPGRRLAAGKGDRAGGWERPARKVGRVPCRREEDQRLGTARSREADQRGQAVGRQGQAARPHAVSAARLRAAARHHGRARHHGPAPHHGPARHHGPAPHHGRASGSRVAAPRGGVHDHAAARGAPAGRPGRTALARDRPGSCPAGSHDATAEVRRGRRTAGPGSTRRPNLPGPARLEPPGPARPEPQGATRPELLGPARPEPPGPARRERGRALRDAGSPGYPRHPAFRVHGHPWARR
jgi:hypothetical protein